MTPELYTDEFRGFKYLSSSPEQIAYYKKHAEVINSVQSIKGPNDPTFVWPCRLEFIEQLLDMEGETVYLVGQGMMNINKLSGEIDYEVAVMRFIDKSTVCIGHPLMFKSPAKLKLSDLTETNDNLFLCTKENINNAIKLNRIGILPKGSISYTAIFYNKEIAEEYRKTLTNYIRNHSNILSTIVRYF